MESIENWTSVVFTLTGSSVFSSFCFCTLKVPHKILFTITKISKFPKIKTAKRNQWDIDTIICVIVSLKIKFQCEKK